VLNKALYDAAIHCRRIGTFQLVKQPRLATTLYHDSCHILTDTTLARRHYYRRHECTV